MARAHYGSANNANGAAERSAETEHPRAAAAAATRYHSQGRARARDAVDRSASRCTCAVTLIAAVALSLAVAAVRHNATLRSPPGAQLAAVLTKAEAATQHEKINFALSVLKAGDDFANDEDSRDLTMLLEETCTHNACDTAKTSWVVLGDLSTLVRLWDKDRRGDASTKSKLADTICRVLKMPSFEFVAEAAASVLAVPTAGVGGVAVRALTGAAKIICKYSAQRAEADEAEAQARNDFEEQAAALVAVQMEAHEVLVFVSARAQQIAAPNARTPCNPSSSSI